MTVTYTVHGIHPSEIQLSIRNKVRRKRLGGGQTYLSAKWDLFPHTVFPASSPLGNVADWSKTYCYYYTKYVKLDPPSA